MNIGEQIGSSWELAVAFPMHPPPPLRWYDGGYAEPCPYTWEVPCLLVLGLALEDRSLSPGSCTGICSPVILPFAVYLNYCAGKAGTSHNKTVSAEHQSNSPCPSDLVPFLPPQPGQDVRNSSASGIIQSLPVGDGICSILESGCFSSLSSAFLLVMYPLPETSLPFVHAQVSSKSLNYLITVF